MKKCFLGLLICSCFIITAGVPAQQDRPDRKIPEFEKQVQINLQLLDIVVVDARGNYVHGLGKEDFILFEDGKEIPINSVDEYFISETMEDSESGRSLYDSPPRTLIFILDRFFSSTHAIKKGKDTINEFVQGYLQPGDRAMLIEYDRQFKVAQDLTTDHRKVEMALEAIKPTSVSMVTPEMQLNQASDADAKFSLRGTEQSNQNPFGSSIDETKNIQLQQDIRNYLRKLQFLSKSFKAMPGKKTVLLLSEGFDQRFISENPTSLYTVYDRSLIMERESEDQLLMSDPSGRKIDQSLLSVYREMVKGVNDSTTSFYVIDLATFAGTRSRSDQFQQQSGIQRALYQENRISSLAALADNTGGKLYSGGEVGKALEKINNDIGNYYIVSFEPANAGRSGKFRKTEIRCKNPNFKVQQRSGYFEPISYEKMDEQDRFLHLVEGLFRTYPENDLEATSSLFVLPVYTDTIVGSLAVEIEADQLEGKGEKCIEVIGTISSLNNKRIDSFHRKVHYGTKLNEIVNDGKVKLTLPFVMTNGANRVNIVVRDNSSGKKYQVFDEVTVRGTTPDDLFMSSIALLDETLTPSTPVKFRLKVEDLGKETGFQGKKVPDPLRASMGQPVFPTIKESFSTSDKPVVFFSVGNYWQDEKTQVVDFFIHYTFTDEEGNEFVIPVIKERLIPIPGNKRLNVLSQLDFSSIKPGEYNLRVRFLDQQKLQGIQRLKPLKLE